MTKKFFIFFLISNLILTSCATRKKVVDEDFGEDTGVGTELTLDDSLENDIKAQNKDEFADFDAKPAEAPQEKSATEVAQPQESPPPQEEPPKVVQEEPPAPVEQDDGQPAKISDLKFLANDNGGTLVISADKPLKFKTRNNSATNQVIVEVQNVIVPAKYKRPLNTKDMTSNIGSVDVYQNANSNVARFVVQLRDGKEEPLVQPEGNTLLVIGAPTDNLQASQTPAYTEPENVDGLGIMSSESIEDFLVNNNKYYGRKISIETTDMDVRDVLKFISEESGVNMVFDDNIGGRISLKLRKVPWDQALVTILKSKKLGYRRQGQVLRVAPIDVLTKEEEDAIKIKEAKLKVEPLVVRNFQLNYADVANLESKIKDFISEGTASSANNRGKVTSDLRTNTLVVTETPTKLSQVEKLIQVLDSQPMQVLIEGRVIEASETYARTVGTQFGLNTGANVGSSLLIDNSNRIVTNLGNTKGSANPLNISPSAAFQPTATGAFSSSLWFGQLGAFGDLSARLVLDESEEKIKILSSPRVAVLHNNKARINQGSIIQVAATETTSTTGGAVQTFKEVPVGVILEVKPLISNVGTVNLDLKIERSASTGNGTRTVRDVATNIIVKNGETAIIGGVFTSDVNNKRTGIPGLKDIPILGTLFRSDSVSKGKTELMFFISPKILQSFDRPLKTQNQPEEELNKL